MPVAVITGSSSGIGRQTAIELAGRGFSVLLHARSNVAGLQETVRLVRPHLQTEAEVRCVTADIRCPRASQDLVAAAFGWRKQVQVWINNAGADVLTTAARHLPFEARLEQLLAVDVAGTIRLSRLVSSRMLAPGMPTPTTPPSLIHIGWDQAQLGMEGDSGQLFCTTKAAVTAFSTALAMSVAPHIRVNCVAPGWIQTAWGAQTSGNYWDQRARDEALQDRWGRPGDVAQTIAWLVSPEAEFINGQTIPVNGGRRFYPAGRNAPR